MDLTMLRIGSAPARLPTGKTSSAFRRRPTSQRCCACCRTDYHRHDDAVSSCSVTLISPNQVITAGHCMADPAEAFSSSVTFDYVVNCNGHVPNNYDARFHKVTKVIKFSNKDINGVYHDYCVLELAVPPGGFGITPIVCESISRLSVKTSLAFTIRTAQ